MYGRVAEQKITLLLNKPWFLPIIICIGINVLGVLLSAAFNENYTSSEFTITEPRQISILSIIAGSLMTLIGITFSISMLILSSVSNQFGPRLMPSFIHSKVSQVTLGLYLGTFIYCIFCIYYPTTIIVRGIQTFYIIGLTLCCLVILVVFLNKVIKSIQISGILSLVTNNTHETIKRGYSQNNVEKTKVPIEILKSNFSYFVLCDSHGYIEGIDYKDIKQYALDNHYTIKINVKPGDFVYPGYRIMDLKPEEGIELKDTYTKELNKKIFVVKMRTLNQDVEYGFDQISEVAVRALSSGINDPYTARDCVYLIGELLLSLDKHQDIELNAMIEKNDKIPLIFKPFTYEGIISAGLSRIIQAVGKDTVIIHAIFDMTVKIIPILNRRRIKRELLSQSHKLNEKLNEFSFCDQEKNDLDRYTHRIKQLEDKLTENV